MRVYVKSPCKADSSSAGSQTRGPQAACGPRGRFVRPAMRLGNLQIINIYIAKCLEKRCREIIESKLNDTQCVFCPGRSNTDHISLSSKISRNRGSMIKTSSHALPTSIKHTTEFLLTSFVECCVCTVLTAAHKRMAWECRGCGCIPNTEKLAIIWAKIFNIWGKYTATFTCK